MPEDVGYGFDPLITPESGFRGNPSGRYSVPPQEEEEKAREIYGRLVEMGYTPEDIEAIVSLSALGGEGALLKEQQEYANALRDTPLPEGRNPTGKVYTAANPLEFIGAGINQYKGHQAGREIMDDRRGILDEQTDARLRYLRTPGINPHG